MLQDTNSPIPITRSCMLRSQPVTLGIILLTIFIDWLGLGLVYPMFSSLLFQEGSPFTTLPLSDTTRGLYLGILLAAMPIAQFFSGPLLGMLSDQKGRRPLFLFSLWLGVIGYATSILGIVTGSMIILIVARSIVGVGAGNAAVVSATVADLSDSSTKAKNFGLYSMACGLGFTLGPFLGGQLAYMNLALPFVVAGATMLVNLLLVFFLFRETHPGKPAAPIEWSRGISQLRRAFQFTHLKWVIGAAGIFYFGWSFFYEFIPVTWITKYGTHANDVGLWYAYGAGFYALSSGVLIRPIVHHIAHHKVLCGSFLGLGCVMLALFSQPEPLWVWIYLPVVNFLVALVWPTFNTIISNATGREAQGEVLGIAQSVQAAAFAISPLVAGPLLGLSSSTPMVLGGIAMWLAAGCVLRGVNGKN